jgi:hypothetical protein
MSEIWSRAWCETQQIPNLVLKGDFFIKLSHFEPYLQDIQQWPHHHQPMTIYPEFVILKQNTVLSLKTQGHLLQVKSCAISSERRSVDQKINSQQTIKENLEIMRTYYAACKAKYTLPRLLLPARAG